MGNTSTVARQRPPGRRGGRSYEAIDPSSPLAALQPYLLTNVDKRKTVIGRGSYAVVKELTSGGKKYAGKQLHLTMFECATKEQRTVMLSRFADECRMLQHLVHPNIVQFVGVHLEEGSQLPYLVMELMNITLSEHLEKNGVPDTSTYYSILSDIALGLQFLHQQSPPIIHRDLSANNVLLNSRMQAKIFDLGMAKVLNLTSTEQITQTKAPGTLCYMPPEALVDNPKYDSTIDIFSFGVLMIHILCAQWPFPDVATKVDPHNPQRLIPVTEFERRMKYLEGIGLKHPLMDLISKCLHNNPANRPAAPSMTKMLQEVVERQISEADYAEALKLGEAPIAYGRVMFLGPGGSGKSSLLDGLMNKLIRLAESTALVDILNIKYHWVEAGDTAEDAWKAVEVEDEVQELASLCHMAMKNKIVRPLSAAAGVTAPIHPAKTDDVQRAAQIQKDVTKSVVQKAWQVKQMQQQEQQQEQQPQQQQEQRQEQQRQEQQQEEQQPLLTHTAPSKALEVMMHVWDCGGQPVFLDILSAFLTSRTMFLLLFDASQPLNNKCQESWRHEGRTYHGKEMNITFLQLMMQWMRLIHASLVVRNEMGTVAKEASQSEATQIKGTTEIKQSNSLPLCPRIMIIGTHGDRVSSMKAQQVLKEIDSSCNERAFQDIVIDKLIINNTTAGRGKNEDPGYSRIRNVVHEFTCSLTAPTPLAWVSFRKVVHQATVDSPVLSYEQVTVLANACGISKSMVPSVLYFYHQLGVFLYYREVESLSTTVIAEPQWLIKQLCKLLMPEWYYPRPQNLATLWRWLEEKGVILQPLYESLWRDCGLKEGAQALVDLLEHFDLAKKISNSSVPKEMQRYNGYKYFVPCMLKARLQEGPDQETEKMTEQPQESVREAATLHLTFNTGYVPPGFFVRLAVQMTKSKKCTPIFKRSIYRDSITFCYGEVDRVKITESKSLVSVHVDFTRVAKRTYSISRFADSCVSFRSELRNMCKEVLRWLPSIELDFAFRCSCSLDVEEHFATIDDRMTRDSRIFCHQDRLYRTDQEHKYWFPPAQHVLQQGMQDEKLTKTEMENVAKELKVKESISKLAGEMEVEYSLEEECPEYAILSDWVMNEKGTRYKLAEHLREAGLARLSTKLLMGDMESSSDPCNVQKTSAALPQKPTLPLLLEFPTETGKMNIIKQIGTHYEMLGILLLNDDTGETIATITNDCQKKALDINREVLRRWIHGQGRQPVTWDTLVGVLNSIELSELARTIENRLN